jgi:DNA-binding IclR family transcriptional regulator
MRRSEGARSDSVRTAVRTLDLLEAIAKAGKPLSLTEIAERIEAPISSCHALVRTLQARGYLYVLEERKRIYPTKRLLQIAESIAQHDPLLEILAPTLRALRDETGETVILGKRHGLAVVYLDVVEGTHTVRYTAQPGDTKPLHSSAIGKAMLGQVPPERLPELIGRLDLEKVTGATITDPARLIADIDEGRMSGFFTTRGENVEDVLATAVARRINGEEIAIAIAGPTDRMTRNLERYRRQLAEAADGLTETEQL